LIGIADPHQSRETISPGAKRAQRARAQTKKAPIAH
jgi:hypothetical protein